MNVTDSGVFESRNAYEQQKHWHAVFCQVVGAYRDILSLSPVVARDYDDETRPRRLVPEFINYKVDIQHATAKALKHNPELIRQWEDAVFDDTGDDDTDDIHIAHVSPAIVRQCARVYSARKLEPKIYLKVIRKGRPDRRSKLATEVAA